MSTEMNENELTTLLERAGGRLDPDTDRLIAGGVARGRGRRARRRVGVVAVGAVAVAAVGVGSLLVSGSGGSGDTATDSGVAASPTSAPTPATSPGQPVLADEDVIRERLLAQLPPGVVSELSFQVQPWVPGRARAVEITLLLDGADVQITIEDDSLDVDAWKEHYATEDPSPRPAGCEEIDVVADNRNVSPNLSGNLPEMSRACNRWNITTQERQCALSPTCVPPGGTYSPREACATYDGCRELADGSWIWPRSNTDHDDGDPTEVRSNWVSVFAPDGWNVNIQASDGINDRLDGRNEILGHVVTDEPVLSPAQVEALATSDLWFQ